MSDTSLSTLRILVLAPEINLSGSAKHYLQAIPLNNVGKYKHIDHKFEYQKLGSKRLEKMIESHIDQQKFNVLIFFLDRDFELSINFFKKCTSKIFTILIIGDDEHYFQRSSQYYAQVFDLVFCTNPSAVFPHRLNGSTAFFLSDTYFIPELNGKSPIRGHDVIFLGSVRNKIDRTDYIDFLKRSGIEIGVYGPDTEYLSHEDYLRTIKASKIFLNLTGVRKHTILDSDISINRRKKQIKGRCQEAAMVGGACILSEYAMGIDEVFEIGNEIEVFKDSGELLSKIQRILGDDRLRECLAANARKRAINDYEAISYWRKQLVFIRDQIRLKDYAPKQDIYIDRLFLRSYASYKLWTAIKFLIRVRVLAALSEVHDLGFRLMPDPVVFKNYAMHDLKHLAFKSVLAVKRLVK